MSSMPITVLEVYLLFLKLSFFKSNVLMNTICTFEFTCFGSQHSFGEFLFRILLPKGLVSSAHPERYEYFLIQTDEHNRPL